MKKRIALCVGHNFRAQGAFGAARQSEYNFNNALIDELIEMLSNSNNEFKKFTRQETSSYTVQQNIMHSDIAKWGNVDYAIEFHFNAAEKDSVNGHEVLYLSKKGKKLATKLNSMFNKYLSNNDRGVKKRSSGNGYGFLKRGNYASIIAEPFFAAHQQQFMIGNSHRDALLRAYADFLNTI